MSAKVVDNTAARPVPGNRVLFAITQTQAEALTAIRAGKGGDIPGRTLRPLVASGLVTTRPTFRLTDLGELASRLLVALAEVPPEKSIFTGMLLQDLDEHLRQSKPANPDEPAP